MPPLETHDRYQTALLWARTGTDSYGQPVVSAVPVEISVRWINRQADALDARGNTIRVDATAIVDREIEVGGRMTEGSLDDWVGTGSDDEPSGQMHVATYSETRDIKGRNVRREVGLIRATDTLPTG